MRELDRKSPPDPPACAVVGAGRLGTVMAQGLGAAGPFRRGEALPAVEVVLLCVPDGQIASAAAAVPSGPLVGHCSGATGLEALGREGFSVHPLMSVPTGSAPDVLHGAGAAIDGTSPRALAAARAIAEALGMIPTRVAPEDRVAYHAAASMAANYLVALESAAERLAPVGATRSRRVDRPDRARRRGHGGPPARRGRGTRARVARTVGRPGRDNPRARG
jgi:hypothetical protein